MFFSGIRTYLNFLSRHKVYTFVSVAGFAVSMAFVIILAFFAGIQFTTDTFHENKDRIFMITRDEDTFHANPFGDYVMSLCPEVETYTRVVSWPKPVGLTRSDLSTERVMFADTDFFKIFSFSLLSGNPSDVLASRNSAVVTPGLANKLFGSGDPVGRTVFVAGKEVTVTGVMEDFPANTHFLPPEIIVSYPLISTEWEDNILDAWWNTSFCHYFLLAENSDVHGTVPSIIEKLNQNDWPYKHEDDELGFLPLEEVYYNPAYMSCVDNRTGNRTTTKIYVGIAVLVLVIALLNYVNMTMAQAGFRGKETAIRKLMGSGRGRIIRQLLRESFLMTAFTFGLGVIMAFVAEPFCNRLFGTPLDLGTRISPAVCLYAVGAVLCLSLVAGAGPALAVSSFKPLEVVKGTLKRKVKSGYSKVLIVFQFAVCTALLICTFIISRQTHYMSTRDVGFNRENILVLENPTNRSASDLEGVKSRLLQIPGVTDVGFACGTPLNGGNNNTFELEGKTTGMQILSGDSAYVRILGLRFEPTAGFEAGGREKVYMNRAAMNAFHIDPVTLHFNWWWREVVVVGILPDVHIRSLHEPIGPTMFEFMPEDEEPWEIMVKLSSDNVYSTGQEVMKAYSEFIGDQPYEWYFSEDEIYGWYENERRTSLIISTFTLLSIIIMVMGVFAMSLYMIRQKEKEIGVRKVNGATVGEVLRMLNMQSLGRVAVAFVIACPVAYYAMSVWLRDFPYRIVLTVWPFLAAGLIVTALCLVSVSWQTFRAARANPVESLKNE